MPQSPVDPAHYPQRAAVIYAPRRRRERVPESCVTEYLDEAAARAAADPAGHHHAALVRGPFRSSEGFRLYFVEVWLDG